MRIVNKTVEKSVIFDTKAEVIRFTITAFPKPYSYLNTKYASLIQNIVKHGLKESMSEYPVFRPYRIYINGYGQFKHIEFTDTGEQLDCETVFKMWLDEQSYPFVISEKVRQ